MDDALLAVGFFQISDLQKSLEFARRFSIPPPMVTVTYTKYLVGVAA